MLINGHFIGGPCDHAVGKAVITSPFDGRFVGTAAEGGWDEMNAAIQSACDAFATWRFSSRSERHQILSRMVEIIREREDELSELLSAEVGKPIVQSKGEVSRLALTFELAADLALHYGEELVAVDYDPRGLRYVAKTKRFPVGPVLAIVPYNWPLNLAAHKLAPALAAGNTVVLKPSNRAPLSTLTLARIAHEAGAPAGVVNAVVVPPTIAEKGCLDERIKKVSFTGSPKVGWHLKDLLPEKRVTLELGGNASVIVDRDANLDLAVKHILTGAYAYAGQICISIQHLLVHVEIADEFLNLFVDAVNTCPYGDPSDPEVLSGPVIDEDAKDKIQSWIDESVEAGAVVLAKSTHPVGSITKSKAMLAPQLLGSVPSTCRIANEEVFGPVATLDTFETIEEAFAKVNRSEFGIHCGIFTGSEEVAETAFQHLEVAGVVMNDGPNLRFDALPYGGVKKSGFGREGVRYAFDEMTELKSFASRVD